MEILNRILPLILIAIVSMNLSGCSNSSIANDSQPAKKSTATAQTTSTEKSKTSGNDDNSHLPEPIMVENIADLIQINGRTITMPTTLNKLSEAIEGSTYYINKEYLEKYGSEENMLSEIGMLRCCVDRSDVNILNPIIRNDDYNKDLGDCNVSYLKLSTKIFSENGLTFSTPCDIDFTSTPDDIVKVFGEPN